MANLRKKLDIYYILPTAIIVCVIPLITFLKIIPLEGAMHEVWTGEDKSIDFFSYYKAMWLIIITAISVGLFIIRWVKEREFEKNWIFIPGGVYVLFIVLSTVLSQYKDVSVYGFIERREGMIVLISYLIICFLTIQFVQNKQHIKMIIGALFFSAVLISIIGIFQFAGHDFFNTELGKKLILSAEYEHLAGQLKFRFGQYTIYGTLYNTNYVGSYMAMLFPLSITFFILLKKNIHKIGMGMLSALFFATWIGCRSRAGIIGGSIAILVLLILLRKHLIRNIMYLSILMVSFGVIYLGMNYASEGTLMTKISSLGNEAQDMLDESDIADSNRPVIDDITTDKRKLTFKTNTGILNVEIQENKLFFTDEHNERFSLNIEDGNISIKDERFAGYIFMFYPKEKVLQLTFSDQAIRFILVDNEFKYLNNKGKVIDIKPIETWGFEGKEHLGSARGYIWSRSIPLLKRTLLFGFGPDTYALYFPQQDFIGKMKAYNDPYKVIDKPHNLYLQIGINTGVISLISVLVLFLMYATTSIKLYLKNVEESTYAYVGIATFVAIVGYLIAGFFNDSIVSVTPVFWVLLGLGIKTNIIQYNRSL